MPMSTSPNLLHDLPDATADEVTSSLLTARGMRLEQIVSHGQSSKPDFWYNQDEAEWVMLLKGGARLAIEGEAQERVLGAGDTVYLPAHCRHRVTWTDPNCPTVWLALFIDPSLSPAATV